MHAIMTARESRTGETQRKVLVVGLGRTGLSVARFLAARGHQVAVTDTRPEPPGLDEIRRSLPDVALFLGGYDADAFASAEQIVVSPGVPLGHPLIAEARCRGVEVIGDVELFARVAQGPVIAVTGSNGKSTVTRWVADMARRAGREVRAGANLGTPALDLLQGGEPDLYALELSSFQLEAIESLRPVAAVVLNVSPDHLDRYRGLPEYAAAKARIYRHAAMQIVNRDDPLAAGLADPARPCVGFTLGVPAGKDFGIRQREGEDWLVRGEDWLLPASAIRLAGRHNRANALAALALAQAAGLPMPACLDSLREFPGLPHRTQWVGRRAGADWYNDSKATNVGATLAALEGFDRPLVLIAGGQGKGQDFSPLREPVCSRVRTLILMGQDADALAAAIGDCVPVARAGDMTAAVRAAAECARPGDAVLLSPACASQDMFRDFEQRGEQFARAVEALPS